MPIYTAFGLTLELPFCCPGLSPAAAEASPDVIVSDGCVPSTLIDFRLQGPFWQAAPGRFLLRAGRTSGRFLAEGGTTVIVQRFPTTENSRLASSFLDAVLPALLSQRGLLVFHANAAVTPKGAVAVSGESGAGKSTTLAGLLQRGCEMLADDVAALQIGPSGRVEILPGIAQIPLTEEAARGLRQEISHLPRPPRRRHKALLPVPVSAAPAPLRALYWLSSYAGDRVQVSPLLGRAKFSVLLESIYAPMLEEERTKCFPLLAKIVEQTPVFHIQRPADRWTVDEIVEILLDG